MSIASALAAGHDPQPAVAVEALARALEKAGVDRAAGVLLLLTDDFSRCAQATVSAVARAAQCTEVAGGLAAGVFTDSGWLIDRPAAAVMVFAGGVSLAHRRASEMALAAAEAPCASAGGDEGDAADERDDALLSYTGSHWPHAWGASPTRRFGGSFAGKVGCSDPVAWQHGRLARQCSLRLRGAQVDVGVSSGWRVQASPRRIDSSRGRELFRVGGASALASLRRVLPAEYRAQARLPLASLCAVLSDARAAADSWRTLAIIAAHADQSLTLAEEVTPGQHVAWAIRQPQAATDDMRQLLARLASVAADPLAAIVFSCIGRGPCFHGGPDRELECLRERFPGLPLIGSYGTGQIAPGLGGGCRLLHNAVVSALISPRRSDVQSQS